MKKWVSGLIAAFFVATSLLFYTPPASAEPFIAAYGGYGILTDEARSPVEGGDFTVTLGATQPDETAVFGGKVGFWFEALP